MSYSNSFPQQRPSLNLDFANGGDQLDSRISFSRADSTPSAVHFWSNEKHLSSLNLTSNSEDFSAWSESNATASANTTAAPDGNTTADTLTGNAGTSVKYLQSNTISVSDPVISVYAKAGTHSYIQITDNALSTEFANYDLTNGTVGTVGADATAAIQAVGSTGWYRCIMRVTQTSAAFAWRVVMIDSSTAARQSTTSSTGTVQLWGGMMTELGDLTNVAAYQSSGSQIHREFAPTLKSVTNAGDPRFEYSPADGQSVAGTAKGLLIESQSSNLATYGSDLTNAVWNPLSATAANAAIGPDGTLSAAKLTSGTGSGIYPRFRRLAFLSTSKTQTFSVYVKPLEYSYLNLSQDGHSTQMVHYNLTGSGSISSASGCSGTVEQCGNGWFRISFTHTNATSSTNLAIVMQSTATYSGETGNSYDGMLFASAQLEDAASASSFIATSSSQVSRAADSCSVALSDVGITSGQDLTAVVEGVTEEIAGAALIGFDDGSSSNYARILRHTNNNYTFDVRTNAVSQAVITLGSSSSDTDFALRVENNNIGASAGGSAVTTDTSATIGLMTTMQIGNAYWGSQANGTISRVSIYSEALSDTNLTALTSS